MKLKTGSILIALFAIPCLASAASLTFDFTSSLVTGRPGQTVLFSGTMMNTGVGTAFINGDAFTFPFAVDDTPFLLGAPVLLAPAASFTGPFFQIAVPTTAGVGMYLGVFSILGGDTPSSQDVLATREFGVQIVPEPSAWALTFGGLLGGMAFQSRRRRVAKRHLI